MIEQNELFFEFLDTVDSRFRLFVKELNDFFLENGCRCDIKLAKNGHVVSYVLTDEKRTVANFVMRKSGTLIRLYADHVGQYEEILDAFPDKLKSAIKKAPPCKRLLNPDDCNSRCKMGYTFQFDGEEQKKCRYSVFMIPINDENNEFIREFVERELTA